MNEVIYKRHNVFTNFMIGSDGSIIGFKGNKLIPRINKDGYYDVSISQNGNRYTKLIHRLVCEMFCENPNNYNIVNHKDGNKLNNNYENLEWCTVKYNVNHAVLNGMVDTVLSVEQVRYIYENPDNLNPSQLSKKLNVKRNTIYGVVYDNKWKEITKDLIKNHVPESKQNHKQKCYGISPDGVRYDFENKTRFAKEHGLSLSYMIACIKGKAIQHRGWKFYSID